MNAAMWLAAAVGVVVVLGNVLPPLLKRSKADPEPKPMANGQKLTSEQFKAQVARIVATAGDMSNDFKLKHLQLGSTDDAIKDDVIAVLRQQLKDKKNPEPAKA